jgi:hypothetical protein
MRQAQDLRPPLPPGFIEEANCGSGTSSLASMAFVVSFVGGAFMSRFAIYCG